MRPGRPGPRDRRGGPFLSRPEPGEVGGVELGLELLGQPGALVMLVGQVDQERLDLGAEQRAELVVVDDRVVPLGRPGGQALAVVAGGLVVRSVGRG